MSAATVSRSMPKRKAATPARPRRRLGPPAPQPLPPGLPRAWYEDHNRRLKAMRLAIVLLDSGNYLPQQATNRRIRSVASRIGIHRPSAVTCRAVRSLLA
ncbi:MULTISPECIES: hypothetical protein [Streptomycetaceae]|uniref:Uncharacterized protein n=2 Tax=Kitasatospora herbaricolor TaxID=68217 RepID=A0ABZ1W364_9ACTN|nr:MULTISPECIES: hypothetical protein [Streptomycetaceae]MDQ0312373.1 hypothetical protein [Kitasatospora herbaricolor]GGV15349.1 hypothetical protein GCM10010495_31900 [Kitasatospora herbaricolor]